MPASRFDSARQSLLDARAHAMRASPQPSEALLWECIRGRRLGWSFRRQAPLGLRFIADFYCPKARLAVEVDGGYHALRGRADARRDEALRRLGCRVLRLDAELVMGDLSAAVARIVAELEAAREQE